MGYGGGGGRLGKENKCNDIPQAATCFSASALDTVVVDIALDSLCQGHTGCFCLRFMYFGHQTLPRIHDLFVSTDRQS